MIRFLVSLFLALAASSVSAQDIRQSAAGLLFGPPATGPATAVPGSTVQLQTLNGTAGNQLIINNNASSMPWTSNAGFAGQDAGLQIWALDTHNAILGLTSFPGGTSPSSEIYMRGIGGTGSSPSATPTGYTLGSLIFQGWTGTLMRTGASILGWSMDNFSGTSYGSRLSFYTVAVGGTTNNENMRIWPDGGVSVGSANTGTDPGTSGYINATNLQLSTVGVNTGAQSGYLCYNTTAPGTITYDGTNTCLVSSARFKTLERNIEPFDALRIVSQLQPIVYHYKRGEWPELPSGTQEGFFAEDVARLDRNLVVDFPDGSPRSIKYEQMIAVLVGAIQQLKAENDDLRRKVEARQ